MDKDKLLMAGTGILVVVIVIVLMFVMKKKDNYTTVHSTPGHVL